MKYCYISAAAALIIAAAEYLTGTVNANMAAFLAPFAVMTAGAIADFINN